MSFSALFYPKSIAVIGASRKIKTVGNDVVKNLTTQGYKGEIYPVNPSAEILYGKKVYAQIPDIPEQIDLAVIAVPAPAVTQVTIEAADKGAQAVVVISAGCKEIGNVELEEELTRVCRQRGISLVGPNCLGVINPEISMNASFAATMPEVGDIAFVSQSGALCTAVLDYAQELGIGFSKFVSIGNKADINELKLIEYFVADPQTKVIAMYVEQLAEAQKLIEVVQKNTHGQTPKPIIMIKSGRTNAGATAVASHTGSLSGGDAAYNALFTQSGIIRAESMSELFDLANIFSKNALTKVENIAIITNAGGPGVITTDAAISSGLKLAQLEDKTVADLKEILPFAASTKNPVDVLGDAVGDRYEQTLQLVAKDKNVDGIIVLLTPQSMTEVEKTAKAIVNVKLNSGKPIVASLMGSELVRPGVNVLKKAHIMTTDFPESAAKSLAALGKFVKKSQTKASSLMKFEDVDKETVAQIFAAAKQQGQTTFPEAQALSILAAYRFPLLKTARATNAQAAAEQTRQLGGEFAMKIVSPDILHKSDVGGVMLHINAENAATKYEEMMATVKKNRPTAKLEGVLLMEMAPTNGVELILGVNKVPGLGTMIMFGMGGIYVEVLKDVNFAFVPMSEYDVIHMIESLKSAAIFDGVRGQAPIDRAKLIESIGRLSQLVTDFPEITELDINPLLALPQGQGVKVLDARIVIEPA